MKTLFEIGNFESGLQNASVLMCELGENFCSLSGFNNNKELTALRIATSSKIGLETSVDALLDKLASTTKGFEKVVLCSAFPGAVLVPHEYFDKDAYNEAACNGVQTLHDEVNKWQLVNVYAVPQTVLKKFTELSDNTLFIHTYTCSLNVHNGFDAPDQIDVHFISDNFRVLVIKGGQLLLAQTYTYATPLDVVYYLLKICTEFQLSQDEAFIILSGFIDEDSALYKELYNYFINIHFRSSGHLALPGENHYPQHYFASIHNLATCVL